MGSPSKSLGSPVLLLVSVIVLLLHVACGGAMSASPTHGPPIPTVTVDSSNLASLSTATQGAPSAEVGEQLVQAYGCNACHSIDGTALVGPTWQGLYGTEEALEGGETAVVDGQYIRESIRDPNAKIVQGFTAGLMPATLGVKDEEIPHIIEYMKSLR